MVTTEELLKLLKEIAEERIPFNKVLGLTVQTMDEEQMRVKFDMRDELVGNFMRGNLHGGVISSVLDLVGGMNAWPGIHSTDQVKYGRNHSPMEISTHEVANQFITHIELYPHLFFIHGLNREPQHFVERNSLFSNFFQEF